MKGGYVYILASKRNGTLYIGSTSNLAQRIEQHRKKLFPNCFTSRHDVFLLVYYEWHDLITNAVLRERQIKAWNRCWKIALIEQHNQEWQNLAP